jgi:hypothetical protein
MILWVFLGLAAIGAVTVLALALANEGEDLTVRCYWDERFDEMGIPSNDLQRSISKSDKRIALPLSCHSRPSPPNWTR